MHPPAKRVRGVTSFEGSNPSPSASWAMIKKDDVEIMLQRKDSLVEELPEFKELKIGGTFTLYVSMQDAKSFYDKVKGKVEIVKDIHKTFYGMDEFVIKDLNGYVIYFAEAQNG